MQHRLARADVSCRRGKLAPCWSLPPCNSEDSSHFRVGEETETSCRQALPGALRVHRLGWQQPLHWAPFAGRKPQPCDFVLSARPSLFQLAWAECRGEAQLVSFSEISLITSAVAEMYGEWPFFCPWFLSAVMVGNPGSLTNIETLGKIYWCTHWCLWLHWVPGSCCSSSGNLPCGRSCVFLHSWERGLSQPHPQHPVQSQAACVWQHWPRYLRAYGASPGLHSCAQEPAVVFQNSAFTVHGRCSSCSPVCRQSSFLSRGTQSSQGLPAFSHALMYCWAVSLDGKARQEMGLVFMEM